MPTQILESVVPSESDRADYDAMHLRRNPCVTTLDTCPLMAEHEVNTDRVRGGGARGDSALACGQAQERGDGRLARRRRLWRRRRWLAGDAAQSRHAARGGWLARERGRHRGGPSRPLPQARQQGAWARRAWAPAHRRRRAGGCASSAPAAARSVLRGTVNRSWPTHACRRRRRKRRWLRRPCQRRLRRRRPARRR